MAYNIGLNVVEVDGVGAPAIQGAPVSVAGFNIITRRGVANRPTRVTSLKQFLDQFGGFFSGGYGAYMVKGFFDNGGQTAYINRVVSTDATTGAVAASKNLKDAKDKDTLQAAAGQRGVADPGSWGNDLYMEIDNSKTPAVRLRETEAASLTGSALTEPVDMSALPKLSVKVDGETAATDITFQNADFGDPTKAKLAEIRDAINKRTSKLGASLTDDKRIKLTSTGQVASISKVFTRLDVTANNPTLGFTAASQSGKAADLKTTGTTLVVSDEFQPGDAILVSDGTNKSITKVLRVTPDTGGIEWVPAIASINTFDATKTTVQRLEFDLTIALGGADPRNIVETFGNLSMESDAVRYAVKVINNELNGSRFLTLKNLGSDSGAGDNRPKEMVFTRLDPGRDGTPTVVDFIGDQSKKTGFYAFDPVEIQLLACERTDAAVVGAGIGYSSNRGDCMVVGSVPMGFVGGNQAVAYGQAFQGKKVYGALYGPWIRVVDPAGSGANPTKFIPPTGHVMGMYARTESTRGIWKAPAGDEGYLVGALDVEYQLSDADLTDLVKSGSVNGIRAVPGAGIVVEASRTLSTDTRWLYVNVRLLFNYVKSSLKKGLRWVRQEPNRDTLWSAVKFGSVNPFLMGLWRQGAFGTGKPDQVFKVICDASNNPPDQVDQGIFKVEIYFYPSRPAETIVIIVGQQPSGATAAEA